MKFFAVTILGFFLFLNSGYPFARRSASPGSASTECCFSEKVDCSGRFKPFRGVTIISPIEKKDKKLWEKLNQNLRSIPFLEEYFALLPTDSYHMTKFNLITEKESEGADWKSYIEEQLSEYQKLNENLQLKSFPSQARFTAPLVSWVIMARFQLPDDQKDRIYSVAQDFSLSRKMPKEFHVTLAYQYKKIPSERRDQLFRNINDMLNRELGSHDYFDFQKFQLSYFFDMTEFHPWDGSLNPF